MRLSPELLQQYRRNNLGLSQKQVSEILGMSHSYYTKIEQARVPISAELEVRICQRLGITARKLKRLTEALGDGGNRL